MAPELPEALRDVAERAVGVLAPETDIFEDVDIAGFGESLAKALRTSVVHPVAPVKSALHLAGDLLRIPGAAGARWLGRDVAPPVEADPKDRRFAAPAWQENPAFYSIRMAYLAAAKAAREVVGAAPMSPDESRKAMMMLDLIVDALAPTNFLPTNPAALQKAFDTAGASLLKGARNFVGDVVSNGGKPRQVDRSGFEVGKNLACTPAKVVYRNELMELLQYEPQTEQVHATPLLCSPPWINKYYIMDLSPGRSLVQWAVDHGHTVFLISYRNPDESMRSVGMNDYLLNGPLTALDVIEEITGQPKVNLLGLCLGGTLTMISLTYLDAIGKDRINNATFLNTLTDFSQPGALGVFTDEVSVSKLEQQMNQTGFLPADNMAKTFNLMRGNDLIWNYVVNNWMKGEEPPAFDLLTWNADSTRMPAVMHSFYLRSCYLKNQLARGVMEIAGETLNMKSVDQDLYFLAAEQDHIAPWRSSYKGALIPTGNVRFVLSNSGHIAGIVNPPNPKSKHWAADLDELPENPDEWLAAATMKPITWWEDWATWISERAGKKIDPPALGSEKYPPLGDAPGTYVFGK